MDNIGYKLLAVVGGSLVLIGLGFWAVDFKISGSVAFSIGVLIAIIACVGTTSDK